MRTRFSEEQIVRSFRSMRRVPQLCRKHGMSDAI